MKKVIFCLFMVLCMCSTCVLADVGPTFTNNAKYSRGVGNMCYYVDWTASSYTSSINSAVDNWVDTGYGWNPIYMQPVSSNYATHMDFYARTPQEDSVLSGDALGYTSFWNINSTLTVSKGDLPSVNYFYAEIVFNKSNGNSYNVKNAKHEMGHAFGLAHNYSMNSIMYPNINYMNSSNVQQVDHNTINYLYN